MPKVDKTKPKARKKTIDLSCSMCGQTKKSTDFYSSAKLIHAGTGKVPFCKNCIKKSAYNINGDLDIEKFKSILKEIDKPFIYDLLESSYKEAQKGTGDIIGAYMKSICSLPQYKDLGFSASAFNASVEEPEFRNREIIEYNFPKEVLERWKDYAPEDIEQLEDFYTKMQEDNRIESIQDKIYLKKLAVINLEQDKAAKRNDWGMFDKLGTMFSKFMQDSKLRAQDRTDADRNGGIRNFAVCYSEVEKDGFIPPWSYYQKINGANQDIVDKTIMHIENFNLRLNKIERMVSPPNDTPKLMIEEIDENAESQYVDINIDISEDLIESQEDGD